MAGTFKQIGAVTAMNLRNIPARWTSSLVAAIGVAGVTLVLVAVLSIADGFRAALELSGSPDVAIVLRQGSTDELTSGRSKDAVPVINGANGIHRDAELDADGHHLRAGANTNRRSDAGH